MIYKCGDNNFKYAWLDYIAQDPVHPGLTPYQRIIGSRNVFVWAEGVEPQFIVSVKFAAEPSRTMEAILSDADTESRSYAMFYSIFRVPGVGKKGMGGEVLKNIIDYCKLRGTENFLTLSPIPFLKNEFEKVPSEKKLREYLESMKGPVEKFHLRNGASIEYVNFNADMSDIRQEESWGTMVNYRYKATDNVKD